MTQTRTFIVFFLAVLASSRISHGSPIKIVGEEDEDSDATVPEPIRDDADPDLEDVGVIVEMKPEDPEDDDDGESLRDVLSGIFDVLQGTLDSVREVLTSDESVGAMKRVAQAGSETAGAAVDFGSKIMNGTVEVLGGFADMAAAIVDEEDEENEVEDGLEVIVKKSSKSGVKDKKKNKKKTDTKKEVGEDGEDSEDAEENEAGLEDVLREFMEAFSAVGDTVHNALSDVIGTELLDNFSSDGDEDDGEEGTKPHKLNFKFKLRIGNSEDEEEDEKDEKDKKDKKVEESDLPIIE